MTLNEFKQHRKDLNLTQSQLADKLGLSPTNGRHYIRMIEKGKREPSGVLIGFFKLIIKERKYVSMIASYQDQILDLQYKLKFSESKNNLNNDDQNV